MPRCPTTYRRILELRFLDSCTVAEAAAALGVSPGNAKVLQHRALRRAAQLAREDGEEWRDDRPRAAALPRRPAGRVDRPRPFRATQADADELRVALELRAARPGADAPREGFVDELHRRLAAELAGPPRPERPRPTPDPAPVVPLPTPGSAAAGCSSGRRAGRRLGRGRGGGGRGRIDRAVHGAAGPTRDRCSRRPAPGRRWRPAPSCPRAPSAAFDLGTVAGFVHRADGVVQAVSGRAPTRAAACGSTPARNLDCPCHTTVFAASGELIAHQLPVAPPPLPRFATREVDGAVQVYAPQV